ncbi:putative histidine kinase [Dioscorea sansibarensis]
MYICIFFYFSCKADLLWFFYSFALSSFDVNITDFQDIIGKTDTEIFSGVGVEEIQDFKREVLERGLPAKREITFETSLFGLKTFLIYVEPVFSKAGDKIGVNYMGMDVTDQVNKREKMAKLREEIAVQKAKETELNKTIHITEETMRAKQMLATMSHEIRSPLAGVVSMTEILANTKLDKEQRQLLDVMLSSGDLVLQLINDILDLSKVESGVMKLEAAKFRPREVVRHVLQTAAASLQKELTLEGHITDNVPFEVIGDVLRIRQILTNLIR